MDTSDPFSKAVARYEAWFERHPHAYAAELAAVRAFIPAGVDGVEVGVGTGRFAAPLGIRTGVEPSEEMSALARERGVKVVKGTAEQLPFADERFDVVLMVTTLCFVPDADQAIDEALRVLRPGGRLVVGIIDRDSVLGARYEAKKAGHLFYHDARFHSAAEVAALLAGHGCVDIESRQTLFSDPDAMTAPDAELPGYGQGGFVVFKAVKPIPARL